MATRGTAAGPDAGFDGSPRATAVFGAAPAGLRFELVRAESGVEPFVVLDDAGRLSRVLLGRVVIGGETVLQHVAVKLQRDAYPAAGGVGEAPLTNEAVDEMWQRERRGLAAVSSPHVVSLLPIAGDAVPSPPLFYCRHVDRYFHPTCPTTAQPLRVCRSDELLRECGLRAFTTSLERYLVGGEAGGRRVFYKRAGHDGERPRQGCELRTAADLVRDWGQRLRAGDDGAMDAAGAFPCAACEQQQHCYPQDPKAPLPAAQRLVAVSFYDFHYLVMPALDLSYDEYSDLLGGADWARIKAQACGPGRRGRARLLHRLDEPFARRSQWLFRNDARERFALEVLRLKLTAFGELCAGVAAVHAAGRGPHLGVQAANVMVRVVTAGDGCPTRWTGSVQLVDLGSARRFAPGDVTGRDVPFRLVPGPEGRGPFLSPLAGAADELTAPMQVTVAGSADTLGGAQLELEARCAGEPRLAGFRPGDLVRVVAAAGGEPEVWVWGVLRRVDSGRLELVADVAADHPARSWSGSRDATVSLFRNLGPACDLFGLGMLLFRTMLANDAHSPADVDKVVRHCLDRLKLEIEVRDAADPPFCRYQIELRLRESDEWFRPENLLFAAGDRQPALDGFPKELWREVLLLGFRLATAVPGFSFASHHAEPGGDQPAALLEEVLAAVERLLLRVHVELFATEARDRTIAEVCEEMLGELRGDLLDSAMSPPTEGGRP